MLGRKSRESVLLSQANHPCQGFDETFKFPSPYRKSHLKFLMKSSIQQRLWWVTLPALILPLCGALVYFNLGGQAGIVQAIYTSIKVFTLLWPMVAMQWIVKVPFSEWRSMLVWNRRMMMEGLVCGLGMACILLLTLTTPWGETVKEQAGMVRQKALDMGILQFFPLFAVFISFFHSLLEEYYWRWFAFGNLHRCMSSARAAHLLGACGFAAHHVVITTTFFPGFLGWFSGFSVGIAGAVWSWMMTRHRSIVGAWIAHMIVDLCLMAVGYWLIFEVAPSL